MARENIDWLESSHYLMWTIDSFIAFVTLDVIVAVLQHTDLSHPEQHFAIIFFRFWEQGAPFYAS